MRGKTAWVAGASGLVGGHLVRQLAANDHYERVIALLRSPSTANWTRHSKVEQQLVDWNALASTVVNAPVDDVFCALGTTKKKTPDAQQYYQIDVAYPLSLAEVGLKHGCTFYGLVSAHGANRSSLSGYLRMKGQLEHQLEAKEINQLAIARPGLLKGERPEFRLGERLGEYLTNLLPGNYRAIQAHDVAAALIETANQANTGTAVLSSAAMQGACSRNAQCSS